MYLKWWEKMKMYKWWKANYIDIPDFAIAYFYLFRIFDSFCNSKILSLEMLKTKLYLYRVNIIQIKFKENKDACNDYLLQTKA